MATYPWRFQADLKPGEPNPDVTVFVGDTITNDTTGVQTIHQDTSNPEIVKLNELTTYIAAGMADGITRSKAAGPGPQVPEAKGKR
jgi:hypothetical protein